MVGVPVICDADYSLFAFVANEFNLVLDIQHCLAVFLASVVPDLAFHGPGVSFFAIFTHVCELHSLFPISVQRYRTLEVFLAPSFCTAVQAIGSIVGMQRICFTVEVMYLCVFHAVGCTADGLAKVGCIV